MLIALAASVAGVLQLAKRSTPMAYSGPVAEETHEAPGRLKDVQQERDEAMQQLRDQRARIAKPDYTNTKCVGGILFANVRGELRNIGYCN